MKIETWNASDDGTLRELAALLPVSHGLRYPAFVKHYYGASEWCHLYLMRDNDGRILGTVGVENLPFMTPSGPATFGFGTAYHAFQPGAGGYLFLHWVRQCGFGIQFGGSGDSRRVVEHQKWTACAGTQTLHLNHAYAEFPGDLWWRQLAKTLLRYSPFRTRIDKRCAAQLQQSHQRIEAVPERDFTPDLLPTDSPFEVRLNPTAGYLNWRYSTGLDFVRYHAFRLLLDGQSCGYVVLNELPHRVIVSACDGPDPWVLTQGIFAALAQLCRGRLRGAGVLLAASHPVMQAAFHEFGFQPHPHGREISVGGVRKVPDWASDSRRWLVNYDWGDNGLRPPFLNTGRMEPERAVPKWASKHAKLDEGLLTAFRSGSSEFTTVRQQDDERESRSSKAG